MPTESSSQKDSIRAILAENEAIIVFTKKDGTEREMKCTLIPEMLPPVTGESHTADN